MAAAGICSAFPTLGVGCPEGVNMSTVNSACEKGDGADSISDVGSCLSPEQTNTKTPNDGEYSVTVNARIEQLCASLPASHIRRQMVDILNLRVQQVSEIDPQLLQVMNRPCT